MKQKKCMNCATPFTPDRMGQKTCSPRCAYQSVEKAKDKAFNAVTRTKKKEWRDNDKSYWMNLAQKEFNAYIRARDKGLACVSCGRHHQGQYHAGHYRSVGACSALRFDERQVRLQCAPCNNHLSGNIARYRIRLIELIGIEQVEEIENYNEIRRFTIDELKAIQAHYKAKLRGLKNV